jgi:hypothetical protein
VRAGTNININFKTNNKTIMKQTKTMKQTAITISMINQHSMNRTEGQTHRAVDGEQRMTSMEIAAHDWCGRRKAATLCWD